MNPPVKITQLAKVEREVARRLTPPTAARWVRERLIRLASVMSAAGGSEASATDLEAICGRSETDLLLDHHLLAPTVRGVRFVFDSVSEWLQSKTLDLGQELSKPGLARITTHSSRIGAVAYALLAVEAGDGTFQLRELLLGLVAEQTAASGVHLLIARDVLSKVSDAGPYLDVLQLLAAHETAVVRPNYLIDTTFWRSLALPSHQHLDLLRNLVVLDDDRGKRPKDWAAETLWSLDFSAEVYDVVEADPQAAIPALLPWFADVRKLVGGEATVADVAMTMLYRLHKRFPDLVWSTVIAGWPNTLKFVLRLADSTFANFMIE